jgi:hypothetical protein
MNSYSAFSIIGLFMSSYAFLSRPENGENPILDSIIPYLGYASLSIAIIGSVLFIYHYINNREHKDN